jgi:RNA polymerase sigma-70 factor (ECF subfamily)
VVHASFPTYNPLRARPERWLNLITVHVAAHYRDRALHRPEELTPGDLPDDTVDETPGAYEELEGHQARLLVLDLLHDIDMDTRAVLIAHIATAAAAISASPSRARAAGYVRAVVSDGCATRRRTW